MVEKKRKTSRMWLRIDDTTRARIKDYAKRHNTDESKLVSTFFEKLLAREDEELRKSTADKFF